MSAEGVLGKERAGFNAYQIPQKYRFGSIWRNRGAGQRGINAPRHKLII